jgi:uncharacterized membrane protein YdjX (TVP38/TMEM64 family)
MRRYALLVGAVLACLLAIFWVAEELRFEDLLFSTALLPSTLPSGARPGLGSAVVSIGLLSLDVLLPIPASVIMVLNGALFGLVWGTLISFVGCLGAGWIGFAIGRMGNTWLERMVTPAEAQRVNHLLARWGLLAVILTRPVPLLAETTAVMAGASRLSWWGMTWALALGALPTALLYAMTGAAVWSLDGTYLSIMLVVAVSALFWLFRHGRSIGDGVVPSRETIGDG